MPLYSVAKPGDDLAVCLGQVERGAVAFSGRGDEEDEERERLLEHVPVPEPARLVLDDAVQAERAGEHDHADRREHERQLVADDLRRGAQAAEQRVLVEARPAAHHQPDHGQAGHGEEVEQADVHVDSRPGRARTG